MTARYLEPPPRDFTRANELTLERAVQSIRGGRTGTAMKPFGQILTGAEIEALAIYVTEAFSACGPIWPAYHTAANGWPDHEDRYAAAYPYVLGDRPIDAPGTDRPAAEDPGLRLFKEACSVCHEASARNASVRSFLADSVGSDAEHPAAHGEEHDHDEEYASVHDVPPEVSDLTEEEARGETLYQSICATCHAADGTGQNWIGSFLEPHPTDFTKPSVFEEKNDEALVRGILDGVPGSSMSAFRSVLSPDEARAIISYMKRAFADR